MAWQKVLHHPVPVCSWKVGYNYNEFDILTTELIWTKTCMSQNYMLLKAASLDLKCQ